MSKLEEAFEVSPDGNKLIGYRAMRYDPKPGKAVSGADSRHSVDLIKNAPMKYAQGHFLTNDPEYAKDYYAVHDHNVLIKVEFDPSDVLSGDLDDAQPEISVRQSKILDWIEVMGECKMKNFDKKYKQIVEMLGSDVFDVNSEIGALPFEKDVNKTGFILPMTSSEFRSLVPYGVSNKDTKEFVINALKAGKTVRQPHLSVEWSEKYKVWVVEDHEGRSRSDAIGELYGDEQMEVHIFPYGLTAQEITPEMKASPFISQDSIADWKMAVDDANDEDGFYAGMGGDYEPEDPTSVVAPISVKSQVHGESTMNGFDEFDKKYKKIMEMLAGDAYGGSEGSEGGSGDWYAPGDARVPTVIGAKKKKKKKKKNGNGPRKAADKLENHSIQRRTFPSTGL